MLNYKEIKDVKLLEPIGDNLVLDLDFDESSIYIPGGTQNNDRATVVAVGPGSLILNERIPCQCKVGDVVLLNGQIPMFPLNKNGDKHYGLVSERRIAAILDKSGRIEDDNS